MRGLWTQFPKVIVELSLTLHGDKHTKKVSGFERHVCGVDEDPKHKQVKGPCMMVWGFSGRSFLSVMSPAQPLLVNAVCEVRLWNWNLTLPCPHYYVYVAYRSYQATFRTLWSVRQKFSTVSEFEMNSDTMFIRVHLGWTRMGQVVYSHLTHENYFYKYTCN